MTFKRFAFLLYASTLDFIAGLLEEWNDDPHPPHRRAFNGPTAYRDGEPLPRPPRVPDVHCDHGAPLDVRCTKCEAKR